eukprot:5514928-Lingulodinium_polyedra.AAC.1
MDVCSSAVPDTCSTVTSGTSWPSDRTPHSEITPLAEPRQGGFGEAVRPPRRKAEGLEQSQMAHMA